MTSIVLPLLFASNFTFADYSSCIRAATEKCSLADNSNGYGNADLCMMWESNFCLEEEGIDEIEINGYPSGGGGGSPNFLGSGPVDRDPIAPEERERDREKCKANNSNYFYRCTADANSGFTDDMQTCDRWIDTALALGGGAAGGSATRKIGFGNAGLITGLAGIFAAKAATCQTSAAAERDQFLIRCELIKSNNDRACDLL